MTKILKSRKIFAEQGGISTADAIRLTTLENNELKVTYYSIITGTSGTITPPIQATFNSNEFGLSGNAILSEVDGLGKPTYVSPKTAGGTVVTATLNTTTGAWLASGIYTSASVALIYSLKIKSIYWGNLTYANVIESESRHDIAGVNAPLFYDATTDSYTTLMNTNKLLGRSTGGSGVAEEIGIGTGLSIVGGDLVAAGATDLSIANKTANTFDINSSTGNDITVPQATITEAGLLNATDKVKLNDTSGTNTGDVAVDSVAEINTGADNIKTVSALGLEGSKYLNQSGSKISATASGTNTYTATISPAITAYSSGQRWFIKFTNANTGAATLNLNSLGAIPIKKNGNTALAANDILAGQILCLGYDGTNFQLVGGSSLSLPGTGDRMVEANTVGTPSAIREIKPITIANATLQAELQTAANWTGTPPMLTSVNTGDAGGWMGEIYFGAVGLIPYIFVCKADQVWARISLTDITTLAEGGTGTGLAGIASGMIRMNAALTALENSGLLFNQSLQTTNTPTFAGLAISTGGSLDTNGLVVRHTSPAQITVNQNNYAFATSGAQRVSTDASRTITGFTNITASTGRLLIVTNVGSFDVVFAHENAGSTAANRLLSSTGADIIVGANKTITFQYDATTTRWRDISLR